MTAGTNHLPGFFTEDEKALGVEFLKVGYVIRPVEDRGALDRMRRCIADHAAEALGLPAQDDAGLFLDGIGEHVKPDTLNDMRLKVFNALNRTSWFREAYYSLARQAIGALVGNELAMQRRIGLSIQLPDDDSSLLPLHADTWSGDSKFEVVLWIPFVDCMKTKSMFFLPMEKDRPMQSRLAEYDGRSVEDLFQEVEPDLEWLEVPYGHYLLFTQTVMHGNRVNRESTTRWTMNCRFKSALSPYADKRLGEFFDPITLRPATRLGLDYELPDGFHG